MKKTLLSSEFHEVMCSKKVSLKLSDTSNTILFCYPEKTAHKSTVNPITESKTEEDENVSNEAVPVISTDAPIITSSDLITSMDVYVRLIINVQLFNFDIIDLIVDDIRKIIEDYVSHCESEGIQIDDDLETLISFNGPVYKHLKNAKQITTWVNVNIPYIQAILPAVNACVNKIISSYKDYCAKCDIVGDDVFFVAKYMIRTNFIYRDDQFASLLIANYQKPNAYVQNAEIHFSSPKDVEISIKNAEQYQNCNINIENGKRKAWFTETLFDDRMRFCEIVMQRFIQKDVSFVVSHCASRSITFGKRDTVVKNKLLFKYSAEEGVTIYPIAVSILEHPKSTGVLADYICNFIASNTILNGKVIKLISNLIGRVIVPKVNSIYN